MRGVFFYIVVVAVGALLIFYATSKKERSLAIVAEVEPQKTAISFPKAVRIKSLLVKPGQRVKKGDLLIEATRPDLDLDIKKVQNEIQQLQLLKQSQENDHISRKNLAKLELDQDLRKLGLERKQLKDKYTADSLVFSKLKPNHVYSNAAIETQLEDLVSEVAIRRSQYLAKISGLDLDLDKQRSTSELLMKRREQEMEVLLQEANQLSQYAPYDGTIGAVNVELEELSPSFKTLISVYYDQPDIIRAYMNEKETQTVLIGQKVQVESVNRQYSIEGQVEEVGSRIVSLPRQMNPLSQTPMWGKEIFVRIPKNHQFLNGEKVFVILSGQ